MPWTLGSEIHVDNLHARENVHIDGDPITLSALAEVLPGSDHAIGVGAMHFDPSTMKVSYSTSAAGVSSISGLETALSAKQDALISTADVPGLGSALDAKQNALTGTADVPGLNAALELKQDAIGSISDVPGLNAALNGKQDTLTGIADVPGLSAALNAKQNTLTFVNSILPSGFGSVQEEEDSGLVVYTPPDLSMFQLGLQAPTIASPSGNGSLTLSSSIGYNTLLTYTPPDRTLAGVNILPASCVASGLLSGSQGSVAASWGCQTLSVSQTSTFSGTMTAANITSNGTISASLMSCTNNAVSGSLTTGTVSCGQIFSSNNQDVSSYFGRVILGFVGHNNWAGFSHNAIAQNPGGYAVLQNAAGETLVNCASGQPIGFRENNFEFAEFSGGVFKCNNYGFHSLPGVTNNTTDARIFFVQLNGIAYWWCRNSANEGGLIQASFFGNFFPSDDRLKFDETPVSYGIQLVKQLQPRRYTQVVSLDDEPGTEGHEQIGFIADDVENIPSLACLVRETPDSHYPDNQRTVKSLNYHGITTISVQALKELIARVEALEARVAVLEA